MENKTNKLLIVDGSNLFWRAYHGLIHQHFEFGGKPTWGIFGTVNTIANSIKQFGPTHVLVAFDLGKSQYRLKLFPEYKAGRTHSSDDGYIDFEDAMHQLSQTQKTLEMLGVQLWREQGVEADDIIASVIRKFYRDWDSIVLISGDKDFRQLIDKKTIVIHPSLGKKPEERWDMDRVIDYYGVTPEQLVNIWALCGDKVDNIPGVKGIGEKTAIKFMDKYDNLDNILQSSEKKMQGVKKEDVDLYKKLVTINPELCDLEYLTLDDLYFNPIKPTDEKGELVKYTLEDMGFDSLITRWNNGTLWKDRGIRLRDLKANSGK